MQLDQVATGVFQQGLRAPVRFGRGLAENDAQFLEAFALCLNILDDKDEGRKAGLVEGVLVGLGDRVGVGFQE